MGMKRPMSTYIYTRLNPDTGKEQFTRWDYRKFKKEHQKKSSFHFYLDCCWWRFSLLNLLISFLWWSIFMLTSWVNCRHSCLLSTWSLQFSSKCLWLCLCISDEGSPVIDTSYIDSAIDNWLFFPFSDMSIVNLCYRQRNKLFVYTITSISQSMFTV